LLSSGFAATLINKISEKGVRCIPVKSDLFSSLSEKENPQGILAVAQEKQVNLGKLPVSSGSLFVALVSPQDPGNIGTILRTIDSSGADGLILLDGGADPYHPTAVRASMGSMFWIPFIQTTYNEFSEWARSNDCYLVGTTAHAETDYRTVSLSKKSAVLLLGSEQKGLTQSQLQNCDIAVSIPMRGRSSSLNLAVAAGIMLYTLKG
jgi:RNA methyltransferase, TrmH family